MTANVPVCRNWPQDIDYPWMHNFRKAVNYLKLQTIPSDILPDTCDLFEQSLLQNADAYRRRAVETITAGG